MTLLRVGDHAPDFTAIAHDGRQVSLAGFRGKQVVVLYFYPRDGTSVCTKEACGFRDAYQQFTERGAVVIGVSADPLQRHRAFAASRSLPFVLLSDRDGSLRRAYGVPNILCVVPRRVTYVIDKAGVVRHVHSALFSAQQHVTEALAIAGKLVQEDEHPSVPKP
jgi:peroxiredoxin Q/BCP